MGIYASMTQRIKELDMQLRKLTAAMLAMGLCAGLAHAEDAPAAGSTLDKIRQNGRDRCRAP